MKRLLIIVILFISFNFQGFATHIVGGELFYDCLGNDNYRITLKVYRDCSSNNTNGTLFDNPAPIGIFRNGTLYTLLSVPLQGIVNVPIVINDPCLQPPANICVEQGTYVVTVNLPSNLDGYDIVYQRCCRNPSIVNIINGQDYGASYYAKIPGSGTVLCNSSPRFNSLPPLVICNNSNFSFDHSATDPDGDVLEYSFYTPFHGADAFNPAPNPPLAPPFTNVIWAAGNSQSVQIQGSPSLSVNLNTGLFSGSPTMLGLHVYGIKVSEYRNGVLISESYRDFQTTVTNCPSVVVSSIPAQSQFCTGPTVTPLNSSQNATYYHWDFGVNGISNDTSNLFSPSYTYSDTGTFIITLIANPGFSCADTAYQSYEVHYPLDPSFTFPNPQCLAGNSFDFELTGNFTNNALINWSFGAAANPLTSTLEDPQNIIYSDSGHYNVTVIVEEFNCIDSASSTVTVFPMPSIDFTYPPQDGCAEYTMQFTDGSFSWTPIAYLWNFGDGTFSTQQNPTHTYINPGVYSVELTIAVDSVCISTQTLFLDSIITVHPSPVANISVNPNSVTVFDPIFTVYDNSTGGIQQTIYFGDGSSTTNSIEDHVFFTSGNHSIMQIVINEFGCDDTAYANLYVEPETSIFVPNSFTPNGDGKNDVFKPIVFDVTNYVFRIFNRWGEVIFLSENLEAFWDGTRKSGKLCPNDVYVYQINYRDKAGIDRLVRGHFTLVR